MNKHNKLVFRKLTATQMNLIIVESPTKAKTITKFLGKNYKIESSFGHIRDLPKSKMGVDIENDFEPEYVIPETAKKNLNHLKKLAKEAESIILATDEDREGEAIAWHLAEALKIKKDKQERIVFHEITKDAILNALKTPRKINLDLVDAQQARRILDRLVGYELSPFLWKKVARGLSAGRVQSVAVRLVVEREREIEAFKADEYWSIEAKLSKAGMKGSAFTAKLHKIGGKALGQLDIANQESADKISQELDGKLYSVLKITKKETRKSPPKPFTTSTLQQAANRRLGYSAKQTMMLAQQLYEQGLITYMRTDSLNLSAKFLGDAALWLNANLGPDYALKTPKTFKTKSKGAQEAHEAIRPTEVSNTPPLAVPKLNNNQSRLYKLIWECAVASQMPDALLDATSIDAIAEGTPYEFRANGQVLKFPGYLKIYPEQSKELALPQVTEKEKLDFLGLEKEQHFTKAPARYSDAGLIKVLEAYGVGRPSTYAPTLSTIEARNYVARDEAKKLYPTTIAFIVIDLLVAHFPNIVSFEFTAKMEGEFDKIAGGEIRWQPAIKDFYLPFHENLELKYNEINKQDIMPEEKSEVICDKCGSTMVIKTGRYGQFLACSNYPECKNIKNMKAGTGVPEEKSEEQKKLEEKYSKEICDKCGSPMALKVGRFGPFLACTAYPKCKNIKNIEENNNSTGIKCPVCGLGEIVQKRSKRGVFYACNKYPDCKTAFWSKPTGNKCPDCGSLMVEVEGGEKCSNKSCWK